MRTIILSIHEFPSPSYNYEYGASLGGCQSFARTMLIKMFQFYDFAKISEDSRKIVQRPHESFQTFSENLRRLSKISKDC